MPPKFPRRPLATRPPAGPRPTKVWLPPPSDPKPRLPTSSRPPASSSTPTSSSLPATATFKPLPPAPLPPHLRTDRTLPPSSANRYRKPPPPPPPSPTHLAAIRRRHLPVLSRPVPTTHRSPPSAPPLSPYAAPTLYTKFSSHTPKQPAFTFPPHPLTTALLSNPYALALATPVRTDAHINRRLPSFFLSRFIVKLHPETKTPFLLPDGVGGKNTQVAGCYASSTKRAVERVGGLKRGYMLLIPVMDRAEFAAKCVWRKDMASVVERGLRGRVLAEFAVETGMGDRGEEGGGGVAGEEGVCGGVLRWGGEEQRVEVVNRKVVPVFELTGLLGEEAEKVKELWGLEGERELVWMTPRTKGLLGALLKLRQYLEMVYVDVEGEGDGFRNMAGEGRGEDRAQKSGQERGRDIGRERLHGRMHERAPERQRSRDTGRPRIQRR